MSTIKFTKLCGNPLSDLPLCRPGNLSPSQLILIGVAGGIIITCGVMIYINYNYSKSNNYQHPKFINMQMQSERDKYATMDEFINS